MKYIEENSALLKQLMTVPPMSAQQYAVVMRKRTDSRRRAEDARDASLANAQAKKSAQGA
ncbi:hypothetical protein [Undibacterium sp.]|uniref:hypothetical protein n=1 Tax=Undibacterium sp. TaxID=1914977 RepID=UPI00374D7CA1